MPTYSGTGVAGSTGTTGTTGATGATSPEPQASTLAAQNRTTRRGKNEVGQITGKGVWAILFVQQTNTVVRYGSRPPRAREAISAGLPVSRPGSRGNGRVMGDGRPHLARDTNPLSTFTTLTPICSTA